MLSIGEFSRATSLTIKTIRLYHEKGLLQPARIDLATGYRYYNSQSLERARVIIGLRDLDFSLAEIKEVLSSCQDDSDVLAFLERQKLAVEEKLKRYGDIRASLESIIRGEREALMTAQNSSHQVEEKNLQPLLIAGIRMKGKYSDCGKLFGKLYRAVGRHAGGKPFNLYYDGEYREDDADFESCIPIKKSCELEEISVRELAGGRCVSLLHRGPYKDLGRSYERIFEYIRGKELKPLLPSREIYVKGPGMIFRGNPKKYITEIQILVS